MKIALAIWFSLALVLTHNVGCGSAAMPGQCAMPQPCCCGPDRNCCKAKPAPDNQPAPTAPACTRSAAPLQLALPLSGSVLCPTSHPEIRRAFFNSPLTQVVAVSIYQRNCAYLI